MIDRRGFLKRVLGGAALAGLAIASKSPAAVALEPAASENGLAGDLPVPARVSGFPFPLSATAGATRVPCNESVVGRVEASIDRYDSDYGALAVHHEQMKSAARKIVDDLENALFKVVEPQIGPVGGWGTMFNDDGDPSRWIDLESFYRAGEEVAPHVHVIPDARLLERLRKHRKDVFLKLEPAPEGALYVPAHVPMEVQ